VVRGEKVTHIFSIWIRGVLLLDPHLIFNYMRVSF